MAIGQVFAHDCQAFFTAADNFRPSVFCVLITGNIECPFRDPTGGPQDTIQTLLV